MPTLNFYEIWATYIIREDVSGVWVLGTLELKRSKTDAGALSAQDKVAQ